MKVELFAQRPDLTFGFTHLFSAFWRVLPRFVYGTKLEKTSYVFWE